MNEPRLICNECGVAPAVVMRIIAPIVRVYLLGPGNCGSQLMEEHVEESTSVVQLFLACYSRRELRTI